MLLLCRCEWGKSFALKGTSNNCRSWESRRSLGLTARNRNENKAESFVGKFGAPDDRWQLFEVPLNQHMPTVPAFFDPHQTSNCHMSILALYPKPDMPLFGPLISRSTVTEYCALAAGCMCQLSVHRDDRMASDRHKTAAL